MKEVQPLSYYQLRMFTDMWAGDDSFAGGKGNNREVQSLNSRTVYLSQSEVSWYGQPVYYYLVPTVLASGAVATVAVPYVYQTYTYANYY